MRIKNRFWIMMIVYVISSLFMTTNCTKDDDITKNATGFITCIDGNTYKTVTIGTQIWMAENLKATKYNDGTSIPNVSNSTAWSQLTTGALCDLYNKSSNSEIYGKLYNWHAVNTGKLCPIGWHVPSNEEWSTLIDYLGGESVAGGKLKEIGTTHWSSPNEGATNETGFSALPGGLRGSSGAFGSVVTSTLWWSSTQSDTNNAYYHSVYSWYNSVSKDYHDKGNGFSVRCVRD